MYKRNLGTAALRIRWDSELLDEFASLTMGDLIFLARLRRLEVTRKSKCTQKRKWIVVAFNALNCSSEDGIASLQRLAQAGVVKLGEMNDECFAYVRGRWWLGLSVSRDNRLNRAETAL